MESQLQPVRRAPSFPGSHWTSGAEATRREYFLYLWLLNAADLKESFNPKSFQRPFFPFLCYCFARIVPLLRPITCLSCGFVRRLFSGEKPDEINSNTLKTISHQSASISWKLDRISFPTCISSSNVPSQLKTFSVSLPHSTSLFWWFWTTEGCWKLLKVQKKVSGILGARVNSNIGCLKKLCMEKDIKGKN